MVDVRRVRYDEWRAYRELQLEALKDSPLAFVERYDESVVKPDEFWLDRVSRSAAGAMRSTFLAWAGDDLVGMASCFIEEDISDHTGAHVVGVYVTPAWRGRDGVAERLVAVVVEWARFEARADRVRLYVTDVNARAAAFYQRIGFAYSGATVPYPPDPSITELEMIYTGVA